MNNNHGTEWAAMKKSLVLLGSVLIAGCGGTAALSSSYMSLPHVLVPVTIPHSYMKTMRVFIRPSLTSAFVVPDRGERGYEVMSSGINGWLARTAEFAAIYDGALKTALKDKGLSCVTSNPLPLADSMGIEFQLACDQAMSATTLGK